MVFLLAAAFGVFLIAGCAMPAGSGDTTPPTVSSTLPASSTINVDLYGSIDVTFSKAMDPATMTAANFTVAGTGPVAGTVDFDDSNNTVIFTPTSGLATNQIHTVTMTTGARDASGNALAANSVWKFTTGSTVDNTKPTVASTVPISGAIGVDLNDNITATFSEAMNPGTIPASFTIPGVPGAVTYDLPNMRATFNPSVNLAASTTYTATITTVVKDLAGNAMLVNKVWSFTTVAAAGAGPAPVPLGTAANFAILAKTGISTVPASHITGDIGVSPVAESYMTGFSQTNHTGYATSPQLTAGSYMYAANMAPPTPAKMTTAISDMQTAYTDAAGRAAGVGPKLNLGAGTLNGNTLAAGTYTWTTGVGITGDINLSGGPTDVWIFQVAGTLNLTNGKIIHLLGGALAKNIFWQVSGAVTLGTTSHFEGNILGKTGITIQTLGTMNGRALAQTLVALQQATVTKP